MCGTKSYARYPFSFCPQKHYAFRWLSEDEFGRRGQSWGPFSWRISWKPTCSPLSVGCLVPAACDCVFPCWNEGLVSQAFLFQRASANCPLVMRDGWGWAIMPLKASYGSKIKVSFIKHNAWGVYVKNPSHQLSFNNLKSSNRPVVADIFAV